MLRGVYYVTAGAVDKKYERETGFEPATFSLEG